MAWRKGRKGCGCRRAKIAASLLSGLILALLALAGRPALAATFTVDSNGDGNTATTLRYAQNNYASGDTISFAIPGQTITLGSSLPSVGNTVTLANNSGGTVTIDASSVTIFLALTSTLNLSGADSLLFSFSGNTGTFEGIENNAGSLTIGSWASNTRMTITNSGSLSRGVFANGVTFSNGLAGSLLVTGQQAQSIISTGALTITGGISGTVKATGTSGIAEAVVSANGLSITGGISGTVESSSSGGSASYGLYSTGGDVSVSGGISGTVKASGAGTVNTIYSQTGHVNGGDTNTALNISGSVTATSTGGVATAINSNQSANLYVTGTVSASGNTTANSHAIAAGANSLLTLGTGASLGGDVNLGGGTSTLTLVGTGSASNKFSNVTNLTAGDGSTTTSWTLSPTASNASTFTNVTVNSNASLSVNENVTVSSNIADNGNLTFNLGSNVTYAGVISGSGSVTKSGSGTLTLTGSNTYSGGTIVSGGSLSVSSLSLLGTGAITFGGGTLLVAGTDVLSTNFTIPAAGVIFDTTNGDQSYSIVFSGTGALTKTGPGTLYLRGTNTYTGGTYFNGGTINIVSDSNLGDSSGPLIFNGGTLQLSADVISGRTITLNSAGGTFDTNGNNLTLNGNINGSGALTKISSGTLYLRGTNTYSGGTVINGGVVDIVTDSNLGSSSGGVTFGGGTLLLEGTLATSRAFVVNSSGGTLNNNGNAASLSGSFSGSGAFTFSGSATTTFSGNGSSYTGSATVGAGKLQVASGGSLGGTLTVNQGATLGGYGSVNNLNNNGVVSPGGSIGTLSVTGNYVQGSTATYYDEISADGTGDLLAVSGSATLSGGLLHVQAPQTYYRTGQAWNVITATGGINGSFGSVEQNLSSPTLQFLPTISGNSVVLTATRTPYATYAEDDRSVSVGNGLNAAAYDASADMQTLLNLLDFSSASTIRATLPLLSPEPYDAFTQGVFDAGQVLTAAQRAGLHQGDGSGSAGFASALDAGPATLLAFNEFRNGQDSRTAFLDAGGNAYSPSSGPDPAMPPAMSGRHIELFLRPFGMLAYQSAGDERTGYTSSTGGLTGGILFHPEQGLTFGLAPGYFNQYVTLKTQGGGYGTTNDLSLALIGAWRKGPWFADGLVRLGYDTYSARRSIPVTGMSRTAKAVWSGWNTTATVGGGYDFHAGGFTLGPLASLDFQTATQAPFDESSAGALGLDMDGRTDSSFTSTLGGRIFRTFETRLGNLTPEVRAAWKAQWLGDARKITASFDGNSGSGFTTSTSTHAYNSATVDLAVSLAVSRTLSVSARAGTELFRPGYQAQAASLSLKYAF